MIRRVALVLNLSKDFDRKIAAGAAAHARGARWSVYLEDDPALRMPQLPQWRGDGIIANLDDPALARALAKLRIPIVAVGGGHGGRALVPRAPYVASDEEAIGRMAAEHLLACGFRHLAYCGYRRDPSNGWSSARGASFLKTARAAGTRVSALGARVGDPRRCKDMM
jgi:LacI family transcriptional regulator